MHNTCTSKQRALSPPPAPTHVASRTLQQHVPDAATIMLVNNAHARASREHNTQTRYDTNTHTYTCSHTRTPKYTHTHLDSANESSTWPRALLGFRSPVNS